MFESKPPDTASSPVRNALAVRLMRVAQLIFFLETDTERDGESPLDALRAGWLEVALRAARAYGEHGAR